jgi:two-component system response regulator TctD
MRILLVEDDEQLVETTARALRSQGWVVDCSARGEPVAHSLREDPYDLLILDIGLPGIDGFEVLNRLDPQRQRAVLIISAYDSVDQRVRGLDLGADDYLVKPFAVEELEARVRALLRRGTARRTARIEIGKLSVDTIGKRSWVGETPLELTAREWSVLDLLLGRVGQVVSKDQIQNSLGRDIQSVSDNAIEVYISRLRSKLSDSGVSIRTLRGFGYMIEEPR